MNNARRHGASQRSTDRQREVMTDIIDLKAERFNQWLKKRDACVAAGDMDGLDKLYEQKEKVERDDEVDAHWCLLFGVDHPDEHRGEEIDLLLRAPGLAAYDAAYGDAVKRLGPIYEDNALSTASERFMEYEISVEQLADAWGMPREIMLAAIAAQIAFTERQEAQAEQRLAEAKQRFRAMAHAELLAWQPSPEETAALDEELRTRISALQSKLSQVLEEEQ
jgi:hypothetical protein